MTASTGQRQAKGGLHCIGDSLMPGSGNLEQWKKGPFTGLWLQIYLWQRFVDADIHCVTQGIVRVFGVWCQTNVYYVPTGVCALMFGAIGEEINGANNKT